MEKIDINEQELKFFIKNTEERYISYRKILENIFKDKINFPPNHEFIIWYKEFLREMKNDEENNLKKLKEEITFYRQGLNPPHFYSKYYN